MALQVEVSEEYKEVIQIDKRLLLIRENGHLGDYKSLGDGLFELRWKNGRRIYFIRTGIHKLYLLMGGYKNEQTKQIKKAKRILKRIASGLS